MRGKRGERGKGGGAKEQEVKSGKVNKEPVFESLAAPTR